MATRPDLQAPDLSALARQILSRPGALASVSVRPQFQTVRVRAVVSIAEFLGRLPKVIEETEARCPVMNLLYMLIALVAVIAVVTTLA